MDDERRHELIERYRAGRRTLLAAVDGHPQARVGRWGGREVLMHVAGWDREAAQNLPLLAAGLRGNDYSDEDAWNERFVERLAGLSDAELRSEYEASADALEQVLLILPETAFEPDGPGSRWAEDLADHALDHAAAFGDIGA